MPALIIVSNEVGELRYPSLKKVMEARKEPGEIWNASDLEIIPEYLKEVEIFELLPPAGMKRECRFISGESPEEKGRNLAFILRDVVQHLYTRSLFFI